jgi:membrane protease YdiL (CAAX protease family)
MLYQPSGTGRTMRRREGKGARGKTAAGWAAAAPGHNARDMGTAGSVPERTTIPAALAVGAVVVGLTAMPLVAITAMPHGMRLVLVLSELVLVLPGLLALVAYRVPLRNVLGRWPLDRRTAALMLAAGASLWLASLGLLELQYALWSPSPEYLEAFRRLHEALRPKGVLDALLSVAAIAVIPALCEETLVRGIVLPSLLRAAGPMGAVVVSAVVFAVIHLDPYRTVFTLVLGLALGLLRVRTGSLVACIVAHAALNALTFAVVPFADDPSQGLPDPRPALGLGLLLGGSAATWVVLRFLPSLTPPGTPPRLGT